ncbi:Alcohol dehydrogenase class-3 [Sarcoptes scabiei]|nr:Alcohol dehydrogenase class-3 [Sarcoptes scabiei]
MLQTGLLVLSYCPTSLTSTLSKVGHYLKLINQKISKTLYVSLDLKTNILESRHENRHHSHHDLMRMIPAFYIEAYRKAPLLDVRVLHHPSFHESIKGIPLNSITNKRKLCFRPQIVFANEDIDLVKLKTYLLNNFDIENKFDILSLENSSTSESKPPLLEPIISDKVYDNVVIGGTFDNLHNGHKILLSTAQLKCINSLVIGVTDRQMVRSKTLHELIADPEVRIQSLREYLQDVDPFIHYEICTISDPFGPAIVDENLQAIIVSEETIRGGEKINEIRHSKRMSNLDIEVIKLLEDDHKSNDLEENKVSSSSLRIRKLGTLLKEPEPRPNLPSKPYVIGLTGMIASGKTSIGKKLEALGAGVINVDLLAHKTYENPESPTYRKIIETFGKEIVNSDKTISRERLGKIVFDSESKRNELTEIVWPEVKKLLQIERERLSQKHSVLILEVALLIESGHFDEFHQIWLTILDEKEVIKRLRERNNLDEEEARKRIRAMMPSEEKIKHANVVFCTYWDESFTWEQIKRAWSMLHQRFVTKDC